MWIGTRSDKPTRTKYLCRSRSALSAFRASSSDYFRIVATSRAGRARLEDVVPPPACVQVSNRSLSGRPLRGCQKYAARLGDLERVEQLAIGLFRRPRGKERVEDECQLLDPGLWSERLQGFKLPPFFQSFSQLRSSTITQTQPTSRSHLRSREKRKRLRRSPSSNPNRNHRGHGNDLLLESCGR